MLKWKRKLNKTWWIETSRRKQVNPPLPKAYAALLAADVSPGLAWVMVMDASKRGGAVDSSALISVVAWSHTPFLKEWCAAYAKQDRFV